MGTRRNFYFFGRNNVETTEIVLGIREMQFLLWLTLCVPKMYGDLDRVIHHTYEIAFWSGQPTPVWISRTGSPSPAIDCTYDDVICVVFNLHQPDVPAMFYVVIYLITVVQQQEKGRWTSKGDQEFRFSALAAAAAGAAAAGARNR